MTAATWVCGQCGEPVADPVDTPLAERVRCTACGSTRRQRDKLIEVTTVLATTIRIAARALGRGKPFAMQLVGADWSHRLGRYVQKWWRADSRQDLYDEKVVDQVTGEIVHEHHQPLSEHRGYGSAKPNRDEPPEPPSS